MERHDPLLSIIETFLAKYGMDPTVFGKNAMNDGNFVGDLRSGREVRRRTRERVERFIDNWQAAHPAPEPKVAGVLRQERETAA